MLHAYDILNDGAVRWGCFLLCSAVVMTTWEILVGAIPVGELQLGVITDFLCELAKILGRVLADCVDNFSVDCFILVCCNSRSRVNTLPIVCGAG